MMYQTLLRSVLPITALCGGLSGGAQQPPSPQIAAGPKPTPEVQALLTQAKAARTARKFDAALKAAQQALDRYLKPGGATKIARRIKSRHLKGPPPLLPVRCSNWTEGTPPPPTCSPTRKKPVPPECWRSFARE